MISDLETSILGLVSEGFRYGYEMEKIIEERNMRNWTEIAFSSIYYVLKRLEKKGFISSGSEMANGRSRKVYDVTPTGIEEMRGKVTELVSSYNAATDPFDLGIGNLQRLSYEEAISGLRSYRESLDDKEQFYNKRLAVMLDSEWPLHIRGLVTRPLAMLDAEKKWVESYITELEAHHKEKKKHES
jgi:DNA-binding PadR family transcriptional regulator